jgi:hypothetical protein
MSAGMARKFENYFSPAMPGMLGKRMRKNLERTVFTVSCDGDAWHVECDGQAFGHSSDKEVAKAHAHKRAREVVDAGGVVQMRVQGEGSLR